MTFELWMGSGLEEGMAGRFTDAEALIEEVRQLAADGLCVPPIRASCIERGVEVRTVTFGFNLFGALQASWEQHV